MSLPPPIRLVAPGGSGTVYEHGAHLTSWTPDGSAPVLWTSSLARFEPGVAIRGGVPIVFPWFGPGRSGELTPAHGFARTQPWHLVDTGGDGDDATATFELRGDGATEPNFPFSFVARYEIRLGRTLQLALTVENHDEQPFSFEAALHAYYRVGDVRRVRIEGLDGCSYLDQADANGLTTKVQSGNVTFSAETDRIYESSGTVRVIDEALGRVLVIAKEHSASTVIWNPWVDKAHRMEDFGDDEWPSMVCVEGGNLRAGSVQLASGEQHTMRYSVSVEELA